MEEKQEKKGLPLPHITTGLIVVLLVITVFQIFQIQSLQSEISTLRKDVSTAATTTPTTGMATSSSSTLEQIVKEITPTGTPDYGAAAGVSYDNVEQGLQTLVGYHQSISLDGNDQQRYIKIATASGTACEFCCGIGEAGFGRSNGEIACGCSHNVAFSGLTKWLIKNTEYSDDQIVEEINKWKILFFPQGAVEKELQKRNINPQSVGLPAMRGGC